MLYRPIARRASRPRGINRRQYEGTFSGGAPPIFKDFGPQKVLKIICLAAVAIVELFASHVPQRMQILSFGDGLEGHFQTVFLNFSTKF